MVIYAKLLYKAILLPSTINMLEFITGKKKDFFKIIIHQVVLSESVFPYLSFYQVYVHTQYWTIHYLLNRSLGSFFPSMDLSIKSLSKVFKILK